MPELVDMRAVYRADPETMAVAALAMREAGADDHRRLLREHARLTCKRDASARRRSLIERGRRRPSGYDTPAMTDPSPEPRHALSHPYLRPAPRRRRRLAGARSPAGSTAGATTAT